MYYKKNKSILRSIRNNKNNKVYYTLVVVMLAAICLIAASIILKGYDPKDEETTFSETDINEIQSDSSDKSDDMNAVAVYRMYIFVEDGVAAYCKTNLSGDIIDIVGAAKCNIGDNVKSYLGSKNQVILSEYHLK